MNIAIHQYFAGAHGYAKQNVFQWTSVWNYNQSNCEDSANATYKNVNHFNGFCPSISKKSTGCWKRSTDLKYPYFGKTKFSFNDLICALKLVFIMIL